MPSILRRQHAKLLLDDLISETIRSVPLPFRAPLHRLILAVRPSSCLLSCIQNKSSTGSNGVDQLLVAFTRMARCADSWLRPPEEWTAPLGNPATQFRSLLVHLFERYPVPTLMARVWLSENAQPWEIKLYLYLAAGRSIRQFSQLYSTCLRLSKKAAAWFMQAPDDLTPMAAMRWAHIRSLGGDSILARKLVANTILAAPTENEPFWESVIHYLVRNQPITCDEAVCIVNFIHKQKFLPARLSLTEHLWETGTGEEPLQPHFTVKGRTLRALRRHMTNWIAEVSANHALPPLKAKSGWPSSGIAPMKLFVNDEIWIVEELLSRESLCIEGGIMRHCVATYVHACYRRRSSIWSMKRIQAGKRLRVLTIEVSPSTRKVVQAKGVGNLPPSLAAKQALQIWANREKLRL